MKVQLLQRQPHPGQFSVEGYFSRVVDALLAQGLDAELSIAPVKSKGFLPRLQILDFARKRRGHITHITGDIYFAALALEPQRTVVTVLDCGRLHQLSGLRRELMRQIWFRLPLRRLAAITVISAETKRDLLKWVPEIEPSRVHVVPVSVSSLYTRHDQPFNAQCPRILQVGTKDNKNVVRLCQALSGVNCHLVIVGKLRECHLEALREHQIEYTNLVGISDQELVNEYQKADILAFASTFEGFGMPIVEAQIVGRPVVTSNCASMPEVAGNAALLVDPYSVESIRNGFRKVIEDVEYREDMVLRGFENARRFDNLEIAKQYISIYSSLQQQG